MLATKPSYAFSNTASPEKAAPAAQQQPQRVGGDPFTVDHSGTKVQFFLPLRQETHLLTCEGVHLYGWVMDTGIVGDHQQWFNRFRIVAGGKEQLLVGVSENATQTKPGRVNILSVTIEGAQVTTTGAAATQVGLVAAWSNNHENVETIQFSSGNMVLQIKSAVARKFTVGAKQLKYRHLDLSFEQLKLTECTSGVLSEIWGVSPMTAKTVAMLKAPEGTTKGEKVIPK